MTRRSALATILLLPLLAASSRADDGFTIAVSSGFASGANVSEAGQGVQFADPNDGKTYTYFGTRNTTAGARVFRSLDGKTWSGVSLSNFGFNPTSNLFSFVNWVSTFNNGTASYLYAGVDSPDS